MKEKPTKLVFQVKPALDIADTLKFQVISDKVIQFTKEKAFAYLELETFQGERPVNERHVQFLYNAWSAGRFMWDHVILCACECNGKRYRINGQHTCWMRVNCDDTVFAKKGVGPKVREVVYQVEDEAQLRTLYSTFDQNKSRTPSHVFKALLSGTPQTQDLWPSTLSVLSAGLRHWLFESNWDKQMVTPNDLAALVSEKHEHLFKIVGLFFQKHYDGFMPVRRSSVIAALFCTFDSSSAKAPEFWEPVFDGLNLTEKTDPRYALRKFLETHSQSIRSKDTRVSQEETFRVCISAWNKWRLGHKVVGGLRATEKRVKAR